jgi:nicotinamidase-related amidase
MQAFYFDTTRAPLVGREEASLRAGKILEHFRETGQGIKRLVIAGMMTHMCVEAAARAADDLGFETILIHDACATRNISFEDRIIAAQDVHLSTLSTLQAYVSIMSTSEYLKAEKE